MTRSPLYEHAKAVVDACELHLEQPWDDEIGSAVVALKAQIDEIDTALAALDKLRKDTLSEERRRLNQPRETERCPGTGMFARDLAGNPRASCPACGHWSALTKHGQIRYHKWVKR